MINTKIYSPLMCKIECALPSADEYWLPPVIRTEVVSILMKKSDYKAVYSLLLTSKAWYQAAILHPLLWIANVILQLWPASSIEWTDTVSYQHTLYSRT